MNARIKFALFLLLVMSCLSPQVSAADAPLVRSFPVADSRFPTRTSPERPVG
jgi:hypothetical protein